jgi:hypothetical protein
MTYPQLPPTARSFTAGDFANKKYTAQDGAEFRILYGDKRVGMTLQLTYSNITDAQADAFINHYHSMQGTYQQFDVGLASRDGYEGSSLTFGAVWWGSQWRYDNAPQLQSVYPGVSTVTVNLKAATF